MIISVFSITGHYICDVFDMKKKGWFSFDDSHVTSVSELDVLTKREKCGYIFFYISKWVVISTMCGQYPKKILISSKEGGTCVISMGICRTELKSILQ